MASELKQFHRVLVKEHARINARRKRLGRMPLPSVPPTHVPELQELGKSYLAAPVYDTTGLAFSGGGIRSAAICLGAAQALAEYDAIDRIDYLSTVSGGGYAGAAIAACMSDKGEFPFRTEGDRRDPPALKHIRNHSNYLVPHGFRDVLINIAIYLRGIFANVLCVLPILLLLAALTLWANPTIPELSKPGLHDWPLLSSLIVSKTAFGLTLTLAVAAALYYSVWALFCSVKAAKSDVSSISGIIGCGFLIGLAALVFCEFQPFFLSCLLSAGTSSPKEPSVAQPVAQLNWWLQAISAAIAPVLTAVSFMSKYLGDALIQTQGDKNSWMALAAKLGSKLIVWIAALALPLLLWVAYLLFVIWGLAPEESGSPNLAPQWFKTIATTFGQWRIDGLPEYASAYVIVAGAMVILWAVLEPNANSLHRLYRDRLSQAFVFKMKGDESVPQDDLKLSDINTANTPYPLYNMALNVQGSKQVNQRGRNADFFMMSPCYCGSEVTSYVKTKDLQRIEPSLNLATAMAISGAAISSNMGSESIKPLAPTLALLNFRLGYWMRNPLKINGTKSRLRNLYLLQEILSRPDEKSSEIYLTDGGHIENLGIYELLRRRCRLIIAIDAEADPEMNFCSFVKLKRYARIDLGIKIQLRWDKVRNTSLDAQKGNANRNRGPHCAVGKIHYSEKDTGILVYIKSSVTGDENDYITDYNRRYKLFPHEATGDQFFSEEQFEVYRALGFHMVKGLFLGDQKVQTTHPDRSLEFFSPKAKCPAVAQAAVLLGAGRKR